MNNSKISTLMQNVADDQLYVSGVARWFRARTNTLTEYSVVVMNILNNEDNVLSGTNITNLDSMIQISNTDAVRISDVKSCIESDIDIPTAAGSSIPIDNFIDSIHENIENAEILTSSLEAVAEGENSLDYGVSQLQSKVSAVTNAYGNKASMISSIMRIITDKNAVARDKIGGIIDIFGAADLTSTSSPSTVSDALNSTGAQSFGGLNPLYVAGANLWNGIKDYVTWNGIQEVLMAAVGVAIDGLKKAWQWVKDNPNKVAKCLRSIAEFINVQNTDFVVNSNVSDDYDFTIDNCMAVCHGKYHDIASAVVNGSKDSDDTAHLTLDDAYALLNSFKPYETKKFQFPNCVAYLRKDTSHLAGSLLDEYTLGLKFIPCPIDGSRGAASISGMEFENSYYGMYQGLNSLSDATIVENIPANYWAADEFFLSSVLLGKSIAFNFCSDYAADQLDHVFDSNTFWSRLVLGCADGTGLNETLSHHTIPNPSDPDHPFSDPTNQDFAWTLSYFYNQQYQEENIDASTLDNNAALCFSVFLAACVRTYKLANDGVFVPYSTVSSVTPGKFRIKTDADNLSTVYRRTNSVIGTAAVIALTVAGLRYKTFLRNKAVNANIAASIAQDSLKQSMLRGTPITVEQQNAAYRLTKKAVQLNKLTGGFASVTTGLATWASGSTAFPGLGTDTGVQDIQKLIAGRV